MGFSRKNVRMEKSNYTSFLKLGALVLTRLIVSSLLGTALLILRDNFSPIQGFDPGGPACALPLVALFWLYFLFFYLAISSCLLNLNYIYIYVLQKIIVLK